MPREVRTIKPCNARLTSIAPPADDDIKRWLEEQTASHNLEFKWLLAHADDGVIWGRIDDQTLQLSSEVSDISPPLRSETLQAARIFRASAELLLWRDGDNAWHARLIEDDVPTEDTTYQEVIDEHHILWGTDAKALAHDFTLMRDGVEGLAHAVPRSVKGTFDERSRPLRLHVRHYLRKDDMGFVRIHTSRLVDLSVEKQP
ncbi:MAG: TIGR03984 family CRISPR-associated protein [Truepera sp.]|nr:TIGR03984 family CRISPR-associated protein [Truepera sp.]